MIIVLNSIVEFKETNGQPKLWVGNHAGRFMVSLSTSDFSVEYKGGKAEVRLNRDLSLEEARKLVTSLQAEIEEATRSEREYQEIERKDL